MKTTQTIPLELDPLSAENTRRNGSGNGLPADREKSKTALMAELMNEPETYKKIGSAWFLYMRLVLIEDGVVIDTYDDIGKQMAVSGNTVRNWVKALESAGIVTRKNVGKRIEIQLIGKHAEIVKAPEMLLQKTAEPPQETLNDNPRMEALKKVLEASEQANGAPIEITIAV